MVGLQHLYADNTLRHQVVKLIAADLNQDSRRDVGRPGMDDWQVVVLAAVRLGCNYDYDKLQDQVENHLALRAIMGIGGWQDCDGFSYRRIRDTLCKLKPETIAKLNQAIVSAGQTLASGAASSVRADSFVVETNIHYPTESNLIWDGVRKMLMWLLNKLARLIRSTEVRLNEHRLTVVSTRRKTKRNYQRSSTKCACLLAILGNTQSVSRSHR